MPSSLLVLAALLLASAGCAAPPAPLAAAGDVVTLEVGPNRVDCTGEAPQRCLLVREPPAREWSRFYDEIDGFTHEEGFRYRIEVERTRRERPPADASAFTWRLLRVVSRERA